MLKQHLRLSSGRFQMDEDHLKVYVKVYKVNGEVLVAACDEELLGATIVDSEKNMHIYVNPAFYKGELMSIREALEILKTSTQGNLIGRNIVEAAVRAGLVDSTGVLNINDVRIAIYVRF